MSERGSIVACVIACIAAGTALIIAGHDEGVWMYIPAFWGVVALS